MRVRTLRLVKPGVQKNGKTVTLENLQQVVKNYDKDARPPVILGHPKPGGDKEPAFGRNAKPRIEDNSLVVDIWYTPELEKKEDDGEFEGFSAGIYPRPDNGEYYLHHTAALGGLPPAADTETLQVVELSNFEPEQMIYLSAELTESKPMPLDKDTQAAISDAVAAAIKPLQDSNDALKKQLNELGSDKSDADQNDKDKATSGKDTSSQTQPENKELSAALGVIKSDRIKAIKSAGEDKGLTEEQMKPLIAPLEKADAIELANDDPDGAYQSALSFINGLNEPAQQNHLSEALELSDNKGESINTADLAYKI